VIVLKLNPMTVFYGMLIAGSVQANDAGAGSIYITHRSNGNPIAAFISVKGPGGSFGNAWEDPSGAIWSGYIGDYTNIPLHPDQAGIVVDSPATEACAKRGGALPTAPDYERLASYFELDSNQLLTDQGKRDWYSVFPDMRGRWFWSSSVDPNPGYSVYDAINFAGDDFSMDYDYRPTSVSVRCLAR
jgi:hypothetical protein